MTNSYESEDWNDTVAVEDEDTAPMALADAAGPIWAVGEARPYPPERVSLGRWMLGGLKAGFFVSPGVGHAQPSPFQVLLLTVLASGLLLGLARLEVPGPAIFDWRAWLVPWWMTLLSLWGAWFALPPERVAEIDDDPWHLRGLGTWFALSSGVALPAQLVLQALSIAVVREWLPAQTVALQWIYWGLYLGLSVWLWAAVVRLTARFAGPRWRLGLFATLLAGLFALAIWQFPDRPWAPDESAELAAADTPEPPRLHLSQAVFEAQQALWPAAEQGLAAQREGVVDVYGLVFAPDGSEAVFRRESQLVADVLRQRFDAEGRVLHLLNNPETATTLPWATPENLGRAIGLLATHMDREHDLLVVYLSSHGAQNFQLSASNDPLEVAPVDPGLLRRLLDEAGIRHRVIMVSACFAGGWIEPLATDTSLLITASDAEHTSYGCGRLSELTFFGRAMVDEQLRQTHSFTQAFERARLVIGKREVEAGKPDGPSNPQMRLGAGLVPVLGALEARLGP